MALDLQGLSYNTSGSTDTNPLPGNLTWQWIQDYPNLYVSALYINEVDINGTSIKTPLQNLTQGNNISFKITGSVENPPLTNTEYDILITGIIDSITPTLNGVWYLELSQTLISTTTFFTLTDVDFANTPGIYSNTPLFLNPYISEIANFNNSDFNAIINNVEDTRLSIKYQDVDYNSGIMSPTNFNLLVDNGALKAPIQDSNYSLTRHTNPRYDGSRSTSQNLNTWTEGDTGTFGKQSNVENLDTTIFEFAYGGGTYPEIANGGAILLNQAINVNDKDDVRIIPSTDEYFDEILQRKFLINNTPNLTQYTSTSGNTGGARIIATNLGSPPISNYIITTTNTTQTGSCFNDNTLLFSNLIPSVDKDGDGYYIEGSLTFLKNPISESIALGEKWYITIYNTLPSPVKNQILPFNSGSNNDYSILNSNGEYSNPLAKNGVYEITSAFSTGGSTAIQVNPNLPSGNGTFKIGDNDKGCLIWKAIDRKDITFDGATLSGVGKGAITTTTTTQTVEENLQYITKTYGTNT